VAASEAWALVAAGAIGAGGAVLAQLIASVTSSRGDKKRQDREDERQKGARFLDIKRELYGTFLLRAEKLVEAIGKPGVSPFDLKAIEELQRIHYDIWLVASPEATRVVREVIADIATVWSQFDLSQSEEPNEENRLRVRLAGTAAIGRARDALGADLTGYLWPTRSGATVQPGKWFRRRSRSSSDEPY
jgi:hypothetical protein